MSKVTMKAGKNGSVVFQFKKRNLFEISPDGEVTMHAPCRLPNYTDAQMNAIKGPKDGMMVYNTGSGAAFLCIAGAWVEMLDAN